MKSDTCDLIFMTSNALSWITMLIGCIIVNDDIILGGFIAFAISFTFWIMWHLIKFSNEDRRKK
jgi:hypothetical protein